MDIIRTECNREVHKQFKKIEDANFVLPLLQNAIERIFGNAQFSSIQDMIRILKTRPAYRDLKSQVSTLGGMLDNPDWSQHCMPLLLFLGKLMPKILAYQIVTRANTYFLTQQGSTTGGYSETFLYRLEEVFCTKNYYHPKIDMGFVFCKYGINMYSDTPKACATFLELPTLRRDMRLIHPPAS